MGPSQIIKKWADLVCNKNIGSLLKMYSNSYYIKPTLYNRVLHKDKSDLEGYFNHFIGNNDIVKVEFFGTIVQNYDGITLDMGCYKFITRDNNFFDANYTFLHDNKNIYAHHSSHFNDDKDKYD